MGYKFITDLGAPMQAIDEAGNPSISIPRYGVWATNSHGKQEVLVVDDDLARLQREHDVPADRVVAVKPASAAGTTSEPIDY